MHQYKINVKIYIKQPKQQAREAFGGSVKNHYSLETVSDVYYTHLHLYSI